MGSTNLELYTLLYLGINGHLLVEEQEIDITRSINGTPVYTVKAGLAGIAPGVGTVEIDVTNAIPSGGFEFDMGKAMMGLVPVDVQVDGPGGTQMQGKAWILQDSIKHGVNMAARYSFKSLMPLSLFRKLKVS